MRVLACYKVVRDDADLVVADDRSVSFGRGAAQISDYDLHALEAAAQLASATDGVAHCLTVGGDEVKDSKLRKSALSRGMDAGMVVADASLADTDAQHTARVLAAAIQSVDDFDLVICGEGSADRYSQQVGTQLAANLGLPFVNGVTRIEAGEGSVVVDRTNEAEVETLQVSLPAVLSVTAGMNSPRIPSMKDILGAGKKTVTEINIADLPVKTGGNGLAVQPELAPEAAERATEIYQAADLAAFVSKLREVVGKDVK